MTSRRIFLISTMLGGLAAITAARAADTRPPATPPHHARPEDMAEHATHHARPPARESITVFGHGSTRQMTGITKTMMRQSVPGTSPLKVLSQLPGVVYQSADPFGAYEYSSQIFMRGFSQAQLGFTLDDIPLGDQQFNNYNGLSVTRAIISDNVAGVDVSQGAGGTDVASTSNLGGAIQIRSADPAHRRGGTIAQTFGSNSTLRTYARFDSGDLTPEGTRFYVSYARLHGNLWKGGGYDHSDQVNAKIVQPLARNSSLKAFFDWSSIQQFDYQDMTMNYLHTVGPNLANYYPIIPPPITRHSGTTDPHCARPTTRSTPRIMRARPIASIISAA